MAKHRRLGLMGGTFDPIHYGHLFIAEESLCVFDLEEVLFFPNNKPAHREGKTAVADPETRFQLTQLAIATNPHFRVSRVEIDRPGPSYAYDTLLQLRRQEGAGVEFYYIIGADSIAELRGWHRGDELFELCQFISVTRPQHSLDDTTDLLPHQAARVHRLETLGLPLASRELRARLQQKLPVRYLTPDAVADEICRRGLYQTASDSSPSSKQRSLMQV